MKEPQVVYFITKHWEKKGVIKMEGYVIEGGKYFNPKYRYSPVFQIGKDAFDSYEDAVIDAETKRARTLINLKNRIEILSEMVIK